MKLRGPLTKYGLAKQLFDASGGSAEQAFTDKSKAQSEVNRIVAAAELFGLVAVDYAVGNKVPLRGSPLLHRIMLSVNARNFLLLSELLSGERADNGH